MAAHWGYMRYKNRYDELKDKIEMLKENLCSDCKKKIEELL